MKNLLLVFCLFMSTRSLAQRIKYVRDIIVKDSNAIISPHKSPLYVINGFIGSISEVNPDDIVGINIIKPPGSVHIYGEQAKNGAILITTKRHFNKTILKRDSAMIDSLPKSIATYVIDGQISLKELDDIDPYEIVKIDVLKDVSPDPSMRASVDGVTISVVTKKYAIKSYQDKLTSFSVKYKLYLKSHQNNDDDCFFILNGEPAGKSKKEEIKTLYDIPSDKIKTVDCLENYFSNGKESKKELVVITTK